MTLKALRRCQATAFGLMWLSYAGSYLLRKPLGIIKMDLQYSKAYLGLMDAALLLPYGIEQMFESSMVDRFGPRRTLSFCLLVAGLTMGTFGLSENYWFMCFLLVVNGTMMAPCWPACCKGLSAWFPKIFHSMVGILSTATYSGAILGTYIAVQMQDLYGWQTTYRPGAVTAVVLSVLNFFFLKSPAEMQIVVPGTDRNADSQLHSHKTPTLCMLWRIPLVPELSIAMLCLKTVRYAMYFWLPMYFANHLGYTKMQSGMLSTLFDVGGGIGSPVLGIILDRYFQGRCLHGLFLSTSAAALFISTFVLTSHWGAVHSATFLFLFGACNGGVDSILAGSYTTALGDENGRGMGAAVTGLVNGFATLGVVAEGPLLGLAMSLGVDWVAAMITLASVVLLAAVIMGRALLLHKRREAIRRFYMEVDGGGTSVQSLND